MSSPSPISSQATRLDVDQAIFTSVRGARNAGYQLVSTSPGIDAAACRELAQWGPAHDSLQPQHRCAVGFFRMRNGHYALSKTQVAGEEYSGRGGPRLYTQFFLLPAELIQRFSFQPFRILEALVAAGRLRVLDPIPESLESFRLVGRASPAQVSMLAAVTRELGATRLGAALTAALTTRPLAIATPGPPQRLFATMLDLLPLCLRPQCSAVAGLRFSPRRPYRWFALGSDEKERRRLERIGDLLVVDLSRDVPPRLVPKGGWARLVTGLLADGRFPEIVAVIKRTTHDSLTECDREADQWWERWKESGSFEPLLKEPGTPPPSAAETARTDTGCHAVPLTPRGGIGH